MARLCRTRTSSALLRLTVLVCLSLLIHPEREPSPLYAAYQDTSYQLHYPSAEIAQQDRSRTPPESRIDRVRLRATAVPDLSGSTLEEARKILEQRALRLGSVETLESSATPGTIAAQHPEAGTTVLKGADVSVSVAVALVVIEVPCVIGQSLERAQTILAEEQFIIGNINRIESNEPPGTVIEQYPHCDTLLDERLPVTLTVSTAPSETPALTTVPRLIGLHIKEAEHRLLDAGLTMGKITGKASSEKENVVIDQRPEAGTGEEPGTPVWLVIAVREPAGLPLDGWVVPAILAAGGALLLLGFRKWKSQTPKKQREQTTSSSLSIRANPDMGTQHIPDKTIIEQDRGIHISITPDKGSQTIDDEEPLTKPGSS